MNYDNFPWINDDSIIFKVISSAEIDYAIGMCLSFANGRKGKWIAIPPPIVDIDIIEKSGYIGFKLNDNGNLPESDIPKIMSLFENHCIGVTDDAKRTI